MWCWSVSPPRDRSSVKGGTPWAPGSKSSQRVVAGWQVSREWPDAGVAAESLSVRVSWLPAGACNLAGPLDSLPPFSLSKQEDNRDSNHLRPLLSLRIPTVSRPACRRGNRRKDHPPSGGRGVGVLFPAVQERTLRKQPPASPHIRFALLENPSHQYHNVPRAGRTFSAHWG